MWGDDFSHVKAANSFLFTDKLLEKLGNDQNEQIKLGKTFNRYNPKLNFHYGTISEYFDAVKTYTQGYEFPRKTQQF